MGTVADGPWKDSLAALIPQLVSGIQYKLSHYCGKRQVLPLQLHFARAMSR